MATEDLLINLELEAKGFKTEFKQVKDEIKANDAQAQKLEKALQELEKSFGSIQKELKGVDKELATNQRLMASTVATYKDSIQAVNAATQAFKLLSGSVREMAAFFTGALRATESLFDVLNNLTDPQFLIRLAQIATILSLLARTKGFGTLSKELDQLSGSLQKAALFFAQFREDGSLSLKTMAERAALINEMKDALAFTGAVTGWLTLLGVLTGINDVLFDFGYVNRTISTQLKSMPKLLEAMVGPLSTFYKSMKEVSRATAQTLDSFTSLISGGKTFSKFVEDLPGGVKSLQKEVKLMAAALRNAAESVRALGPALATGIIEPARTFIAAAQGAAKLSLEAYRKEIYKVVALTEEPFAQIIMVQQTFGERFSRGLEAFAKSGLVRSVENFFDSFGFQLTKKGAALFDIAETVVAEIVRPFAYLSKAVMRTAEFDIITQSFKNIQLQVQTTVGALKTAFDSLSKSSTVGAMRVGLFQQGLLNLSYGAEVAGEALRKGVSVAVRDVTVFARDSLRLLSIGALFAGEKVVQLTGAFLGFFHVVVGAPLSPLLETLRVATSRMGTLRQSILLLNGPLKSLHSFFVTLGATLNEISAPMQVVFKSFYMAAKNMQAPLFILLNLLGDIPLMLAGIPPLGTIFTLSSIASTQGQLSVVLKQILYLKDFTIFAFKQMGESAVIFGQELGALGMRLARTVKGFVAFDHALMGFLTTSSAGAQQVGIFQRLLLTLEYNVERVSKTFSELGASFTQTLMRTRTLGAALKAALDTGLRAIGPNVTALASALVTLPLSVISQELQRLAYHLMALSPAFANVVFNAGQLAAVFGPLFEELSGGALDILKSFGKVASFLPTVLDDILFAFKSAFTSKSFTEFSMIFVGSWKSALTLMKNITVMGLEEVGAVVATRGTTIAGIFGVAGRQMKAIWNTSLDEMLLAATEWGLRASAFLGKGMETAARAVKVFSEGFVTGFTAPIQAASVLARNFGGIVRGVTPSLLTLTEAGSIVGPALLAVGTSALKSESALVKFGGAAAVVAAVALTGLATAMLFFLGTIGRFVEGIGDNLLNAMTRFEEKFQKAQIVVKAFEFTIVNFGKKLGTEVVGTLDGWNQKVDDLAKNTILATNDIRKGVQLLVAESQVVGLSLAQNEKLLARAADLAAAKGVELSQVVDSLIGGITGQATAVRALGINLTEHAVQHSKFTEELENEGVELTATVRSMIRFNEVMEQTAPLAGFAAAALHTIVGATAQLDKTLENVQVALGEQSQVTVLYITALKGLAEAFLDLPKSILYLAGSLIDIGGVVGKVGGLFLQYALLISSLTSLYAILNAALLSSTFAQGQLGAATLFAAKALGVQTVAVTGLNSVLLNLLLLVKGALIKALASLGTTLLGLAKGFVTVLYHLGPVLIKFVLLGTIIAATSRAIGEIYEELKKLDPSLKDVNGEAQKTATLFERITEILRRTFQALVNLIKFALVGLVQLYQMAVVAATGFEMLWAKMTRNTEESARLNAKLRDLMQGIGDLEKLSDQALLGMFTAFEDTAVAAEALDQKIKKVGKSLKGVSNFRLAQAVSEVKLDVLGSDVDKANKKLKESVELFEDLKKFGMIKIGTELLLPTAENLNKFLAGSLNKDGEKAAFTPATEDALTTAAVDAERARLEIVKRNQDALKELGRISADNAVKELEANNQAIAAIQLRGQHELGYFQEKFAAISRNNELYRQAEAAIKASTAAEVAQKELEIRKKDNEELQKRIELLNKLNADMNNLALANAQAMGDFEAVGAIQLKQRLGEIDALEAQAAAYGPINKEQQAHLDMARGLAAIKFDEFMDANSISSQMLQAIEAIQPENIGGRIAKGLLTNGIEAAQTIMDMVEGGMKVFDAVQSMDFSSLDKALSSGKDAFAKIFSGTNFRKLGIEAGTWVATKFIQGGDLIGKLFDPEQINKLADFFENFLQKLPDALGKAFQRLDRVLAKFIEAFPKLVQKLLDMLPGIFQSILSKIPALIDALIDGLMQFLDKLPSLIAMILDALPGILTKLVQALPSIILKLFSAIGSIISQLIKAMPELLKILIDGFPDFVRAFIEGIIAMIGDIVTAFIDDLLGGGLERVVGAILRMIPKLIVAIVQGIARGLARALGSIFGGIKAPPALAKLPGQFSKGIKDLAKNATKEASKLFKVLDLEAAAPGIGKGANPAKQIEDAFIAAGKRIAGLWEHITNGWRKLWGWIKALWDGMMQLLRYVWDTVKQIWGAMMSVLKMVWEGIQALWRGMMAALRAVWDFVKVLWDGLLAALSSVWTAMMGAFAAVWETVQNLWSGFIASLSGAWNNIKILWDGIIAAFQGVVNIFKGIFDNMKKVFTEAFDGIKSFFSDIFKGKIKEAFSDVLDTFSKIGGTIWDGLMTAKDKAGDVFGDLGTKIWDSLKSAFSGIGKIFKDALDAINPANMLGKIFKFDGGGKGGVENALSTITGTDIDVPFTAFARGGLVPGNAAVGGDSALNDRILALLSPGEAIVPRSVMNNPALASLVNSIISGSLSPPKFFGGALGKASGTLSGAAQTAGGDISGAAQTVGGQVSDAFKDVTGALDPAKLWSAFKDKALQSVWDMLQNAKFHQGGLVPAFANGGEVPALLQSGEFVINRQAVNSLGLGALNQMNKGKVPGNQEFNFNIRMDVRADNLPDESFIRQRLIPTLKKELKDASLRGEFLMSNKGLRTT